MATIQNLYVEPGATYDAIEFQYLQDDGVTPESLTGFTATLVVKDDQDATVLTKNLSIQANSIIPVVLTHTETALFANKSCKYVLKVAHSSGEPVIHIARGNIAIEPNEVF